MQEIDFLVSVSGPDGTLTWEMPEEVRNHLKVLASEKGEEGVRHWLKRLELALSLHMEVLVAASLLFPLAEGVWGAGLVTQLQQIALLKLRMLRERHGAGAEGLSADARAELMALMRNAAVSCELRLVEHSNRKGTKAVEVVRGETLLGMVYPTDVGIGVVSKHFPRDPQRAVSVPNLPIPGIPALRIDMVPGS